MLHPNLTETLVIAYSLASSDFKRRPSAVGSFGGKVLGWGD